MPKLSNVMTYRNVENKVNYKPFFDNEKEYHNFVLSMLEAEKNNQLPIALEHINPMSVTINDIKRFIATFKKDTGLFIDFKQYTCSNCDKLHLIIFIDEEE